MAASPINTPAVAAAYPTRGGIQGWLDRVNVVTRAAVQNQVPLEVLFGVYAAETGLGKNVRTSSAGAQGHFQFIPDTAKAYDYPLTNNPNSVQFAQQANAAAKYLADLYKQTGDWDTAIRRYSGGGYGLKDAKAKLKEHDDGGILGNIPGVKEVQDAAGAVADTAGDLASIVGKFFSLITSLDFWLRLGEGIAGLVLIAMGLKALTGVTVPTPVGRV